MTTTVRELRSEDQILGVVSLAKAHWEECAGDVPFLASSTIATCVDVVQDFERKGMNVWVLYKDEQPVGYAVGIMKEFFFNEDYSAQLEILHILPEHRGGWGAIKLVKCFEQWARAMGALQLYVGVARTDKDEAKHIRKLFPRLKYEWCGSYYLKETRQ